MAPQAPAPPNPKSAAPSNNQVKANPKSAAALAEENFWKRHSAHHEFPLSTATSIALHVPALILMIVAGWWVSSMIERGKLEVSTLEASTFAGGGGNRQGEGNPPGDRPPVSPPENVDERGNDTPKPPGEVPALDPLKKDIIDPLDVILQDANGRAIDQANEAVQSLKKLSIETRRKLLNPLGPGKGIKGSGRDGGTDSGKDTGKDKFSGAGVNKPNRSQTRVLRWIMRFNTLNGNDYRRQLAGLRAILAFPQPDGGYVIYRDLSKTPAKGKVEDIGSIKSIFWVDEKKD
jgi:hypothetical protein